MPKRMDVLYNVWNGDVEQVYFLEEGLNPGATIPTYLVRSITGRISRVSTGHYCETLKEAWERYLEQCEKCVPQLRRKLDEVTEDIAMCEYEIKRAVKKIESLS